MKFSKETFMGGKDEYVFPDSLHGFVELDQLPLSGERYIATYNDKKFAVVVSDVSHDFDEIVPVAPYESRKEEIILKEIASEIYRLYDVPVLSSRLYSEDEKLARVTEIPDQSHDIVSHFKHLPESKKSQLVAEYQQGFVLDRLLGNRDTYDMNHVVVNKHGKIVRTTMGLSLNYVSEDDTPYTESYVDLNKRNDYEHWLLIGLDSEAIRTGLARVVEKKLELFAVFDRTVDRFRGVVANEEYFTNVRSELEKRIQYLEHILHRDYEHTLENDTRYTQVLGFLHSIFEKRSVTITNALEGVIASADCAQILRQDLLDEVSKNVHDYVDSELVSHISDNTLLYLADMFCASTGEIVDFPLTMRDAIARHIIALEESSYPFYKRLADNYGISIDTYKQRLQTHIEMLVSKSDMYVAVSPHVIPHIYRERRFKTQFEVSQSGSLYNRGARAELEHAFFGFSRDVTHDVKKRPLYGYLSDNHIGLVHGVYQDAGEEDNLARYGGVHFKMKKEKLLHKTTVTFGDSQLSHGYSPSPYAKPHFTSFDVEYMDPLDISSTSVIDETMQHEYFEVQFHGGVSVNDIEAVYINETAIPYTLMKQLVAQSHEQGIAVHVYS